MTDIELLPSSVAAFTEALKGERGSLDAWLEVNGEREVAAHVEAYTRACVAHATAAKDAEIEALRAEVAAVWSVMPSDARYLDPPDGGDVPLHEQVRRMAADAARAKRLAEALRELRDLMLGQVKWMPCDCGCPQQRTPDGPHSVTWLRAVQQVEIAISKAEGKE